MGIVQSYARATVSSNLRSDEHHHDHEKLAAVALSGLADGSWPHSNLLLRVKYAGDSSSYSTLAEEWRAHVKIKAALRGWPLEVSASKIARLSLDHWLNDVCPLCVGRGSLPHEGIANVLSDEPCPACAGTGVRPIDLKPSAIKHFATDVCHWWPIIRPVMLIQYVTDMVEVLNVMTIRAGSEAIRKLASEMPEL